VSDAITLLFSGVVAVSTVVYAVLTWQLVAETRKMRRAQTEPRISVVIQPEENAISLFDMKIENIGMGPAKDIQMTVAPDMKCITGQKLSEMDLIKKGIPYLAPREKIQFVLANGYADFSELSKSPYEIVVEYRDCIGTPYHETFFFDFSLYAGMMQRGGSPLHTIADEMKEIRKEIGKIETKLHR